MTPAGEVPLATAVYNDQLKTEIAHVPAEGVSARPSAGDDVTLKLDWGPIVVAPDGNSAVVTTIETWQVVSTAGTVDDAPQRNDYTLVLDNATWKIKADVLVAVPTQTR